MNHYLCKFIPSRVDLLSTMTEPEAELMQQHGRYLDSLLEAGKVVAHGPVVDPNGGYGVSIFSISDEEDIALITAADPAVQGKLGNYLHFSMLKLRAR